MGASVVRKSERREMGSSGKRLAARGGERGREAEASLGFGWALEAGPKERRSQLGLLDWALPLLSLFFKRKENSEREEKEGGVREKSLSRRTIFLDS